MGVLVVGRGGGCVGVRGLGVGFEASRGGCVGMRGFGVGGDARSC